MMSRCFQALVGAAVTVVWLSRAFALFLGAVFLVRVHSLLLTTWS